MLPRPPDRRQRRGRYDRGTLPIVRRQRRRRAVLRAALAIVVAEGTRAVTVERVVTRACVGRSALYDHFDDADDLLAELAADLAAELAHTLDLALREAPTPRARVRALIVTLLGTARRQPRQVQALTGHLRRFAAHGTVVADLVLAPLVGRIVDAALGAGTLGGPPAPWRVHALCGALEQWAWAAAGGAGAPDDSSADDAAWMLLGMLR